MNTIPHMIDHTHPNTKIAVLNCNTADKKQMQNERHPYPGPYSVCEPITMLNEATKVPEISNMKKKM